MIEPIPIRQILISLLLIITPGQYRERARPRAVFLSWAFAMKTSGDFTGLLSAWLKSYPAVILAINHAKLLMLAGLGLRCGFATND